MMMSECKGDRLAQMLREGAWRQIHANFDKSAPHRYIRGIAVSSRGATTHGTAYLARGLQQFSLPMPLLWRHDYSFPLGQVETISVHGDVVHFRARMNNVSAGPFWIPQIWNAILSGEVRCVSKGGIKALSPTLIDGAHAAWTMDEISVCEEGADRNARIVRVWERQHTVRLYGSNETVHWSES